MRNILGQTLLFSMVICCKVVNLGLASFSVEITLLAYDSYGQEYNGGRCDPLGDLCDIQFLICLDNPLSSNDDIQDNNQSCPLGYFESPTLYDVNSITFLTKNDLGSYYISQVHLPFQGGIRFKARVLDKDTFASDLIDTFDYQIHNLQRSFKTISIRTSTIYGERSNTPSELVFGVSVRCLPDYYNTSCDTYCETKNDDIVTKKCDPETGEQTVIFAQPVCISGQYLLHSGLCEVCPRGTFQELAEHRQSMCILCPPGTTTPRTGSTSIQYCVFDVWTTGINDPSVGLPEPTQSVENIPEITTQGPAAGNQQDGLELGIIIVPALGATVVIVSAAVMAYRCRRRNSNTKTTDKEGAAPGPSNIKQDSDYNYIDQNNITKTDGYISLGNRDQQNSYLTISDRELQGGSNHLNNDSELPLDGGYLKTDSVRSSGAVSQRTSIKQDNDYNYIDHNDIVKTEGYTSPGNRDQHNSYLILSDRELQDSNHHINDSEQPLDGGYLKIDSEPSSGAVAKGTSIKDKQDNDYNYIDHNDIVKTEEYTSPGNRNQHNSYLILSDSELQDSNHHINDSELPLDGGYLKIDNKPSSGALSQGTRIKDKQDNDYNYIDHNDIAKTKGYISPGNRDQQNPCLILSDRELQGGSNHLNNDSELPLDGGYLTTDSFPRSGLVPQRTVAVENDARSHDTSTYIEVLPGNKG